MFEKPKFKKILFYLHFTKIGGAEVVAMQYMRKLVENRYRVDLIIDYNLGKQLNSLEASIPAEVKYTYVKNLIISKIIYYFRNIGKRHRCYNLLLYPLIICTDFYYYYFKVRNLIKKNGYDCTITFFQYLPSYITKEKNCKHIIWLHGSVDDFFIGIRKYFKNIFLHKLHRYDEIVIIANGMREQINRLFPEISNDKIKLLYNVFDFKRIREMANCDNSLSEYEMKLLKHPYICTVVRIDEAQKDITSLLKALAFLNNSKQLNVKLYIIGDGPDFNNIEKLIEQLGLTHYVSMLGKKTNPYLWIMNSILFVLSSKMEGLPTVIIEAMILGKFVISSDCKTGPYEITLGGKCGDLFPVSDYVELANLILHALADEKYRQSKIDCANQLLYRFDSDYAFGELVKML